MATLREGGPVVNLTVRKIDRTELTLSFFYIQVVQINTAFKGLLKIIRRRKILTPLVRGACRFETRKISQSAAFFIDKHEKKWRDKGKGRNEFRTYKNRHHTPIKCSQVLVIKQSIR